MEPEGSSQHSQAPATCPYPEPAQSKIVATSLSMTVQTKRGKMLRNFYFYWIFERQK
jgi:hypothetical protein